MPNIKIVEARRIPPPTQYGMTAMGYTKNSGAPTDLMVRIEGESRLRRLMVWQFSNAPTLWVRVKGQCCVISQHEIPTPTE